MSLRMMRLTAVAALLAGIVGCSTADGVVDEPPTLEVTSPERGTTSDDRSVTVTGRATDGGKPVRVSVNGTAVTPAADGSFSATVAVESGISVIETHAIDDGGNDVRDVRAILAGTLAPSDGSISAPIGARVGVPGLRSIGSALGTTAENIDFTTAVKAMNPVYQNTGCLGATVNVTSVALSNIDVSLVPATNVLTTGVTIENVVVKAAVNYKVACIGGSSNVTIRATKARINGNLGVAVASGKLTTTLPSATVVLDGFDIDASGIPGAIEDLLRGQVRDAVANALTKVIRDRVPPMANTALAGLVSKPLTADVLGHATNVSITPKQVVLGTDGLFIAVDSKLAVTGGEGGMFVTRAAPIDAAAMETSTGLSVALADDLVNQLFSGLWAAGALDQTLSIDSVGVVGALLDDDARSLTIELMLPPTVTTRGTDLTLSIGDLIVSVRDEAGTEIQRLALSISTTLAAEPTQTGKILLTVGAPEVKAQVLAQSEVVDRLLTDEQVEGIVTGVWGVVGGQADQALSTLPMPSVAGVTLGAPTIEGRDGFVLAAMTLE